MSFSLKRGHLSAVGLGRKMFARVPDMTPARFDLLHLLFDATRRRSRFTLVTQVEARKRLGLRRQTVWKMIARLVELGLVAKIYDDTRRVHLSLTAEGMKRIRIAYGVAFTERYPLPPDVPLGTPQARSAYRIIREEAWRSDELAKRARALTTGLNPTLFRDLEQSMAPPKVGREVGNVFTKFAWNMTDCDERARPRRYLDTLDAMICTARELAAALGDESDLVHELAYEPDH